MVDDVEGLTDVCRDDGGPRRRFGLVEALRDCSSERKEGGSSGVLAPEAMLGGVGGKGGFKLREEEAFEEFGDGTEEGDGKVGEGGVEGFVGFRDGNDVGALPQRRNIGRPHRQVEEVREVTDPQRTELL